MVFSQNCTNDTEYRYFSKFKFGYVTNVRKACCTDRGTGIKKIRELVGFHYNNTSEFILQSVMDPQDVASNAGTNGQAGVALGFIDAVIPVLWRLGTVVAGLVAVLAGFLYVKQESLLYFPGK